MKMVVEVKVEKVDGGMEFDVLVDGKCHHRATKGVLIEDTEYGANVAISGTERTLIVALYALEEQVKNRGLYDKYELYKKFMGLTVDNIGETLEALNKMLEKQKQ
jgi:hypothetical protein